MCSPRQTFICVVLLQTWRKISWWTRSTASVSERFEAVFPYPGKKDVEMRSLLLSLSNSPLWRESLRWVLSEEDLHIWFSKETAFRLSGDRRADVFRLFQSCLSGCLFPAVVLPQYGDVYFGGGPCVLNLLIGSVDPESELKTFTTRVRRLPLAQLKTYLLYLHYFRGKSFPCAPRDEVMNALWSSMLERWNE